MNESIRAGLADTPRSIEAAQRVRAQVFVHEKELLSHPEAKVDREADMYDELETTRQFIAYVGDAPVATARLILPSPEVARALGAPLGLDLAARYDLGPFAASGVSVAEVSRMCVVPDHRGTAVLGALYLSMVHESLRLGLTHWVGAANAETDALADAEIAYRIAERRGLVSARFRVTPRPSEGESPLSRRPLYTSAERRRAQAGDLDGLRWPRTLETFARLAARYMGRPLREHGYTVCSLPLVVDMAEAVRTRVFQRSVGR